MICKFHAAMQNAALCFIETGLLSFLLTFAPLGHAEKADRGKPLKVEADNPSKIDIAKQVVTFNGNVVVTQGTMTIRADRIEVRETPEGQHVAIATGGTPTRPASFRQKRDGVDEWIEGQAERLEYDGRSDVIRFVGNAQVRRLRGSNIADEVSGASISYDNTAEVFTVVGATPKNPDGRVRAVIMPRDAPASAPSAQ
jgi:lipopolysaccharide export system protein LptA